MECNFRCQHCYSSKLFDTAGLKALIRPSGPRERAGQRPVLAAKRHSALRA